MILIFDSELGGHHLEYIHHYWMGIADGITNEQYTIAVPKREWDKMHHILYWPKTENITLRLLTDEELVYIPKSPIFKRSEKESVLIGRLVRELKSVERIILSNLAVALPLLTLFIPKNIRVTGIIYTIDYYAHNSGLRKMRERLFLNILANNKRFDKVLLLNSKKAVEYYNNKYKTTHFKYLVDPVPEIGSYTIRNLRKQYGIKDSSIIFLHFGVMSHRKGTIELLRAILNLDNKRNRTFIFAGQITQQIRDEFFQLKDKITAKGIEIIVIDRLLEFDELMSLCNTADCIIAPYLETGCSSGVIGYGAIFGKPIIGNSNGLLGELIRDNNLGYTTEINARNLSTVIQNFMPYRVNTDYVKTNTVESFCRTILQ